MIQEITLAAMETVCAGLASMQQTGVGRVQVGRWYELVVRARTYNWRDVTSSGQNAGCYSKCRECRQAGKNCNCLNLNCTELIFY